MLWLSQVWFSFLPYPAALISGSLLAEHRRRGFGLWSLAFEPLSLQTLVFASVVVVAERRLEVANLADEAGHFGRQEKLLERNWRVIFCWTSLLKEKRLLISYQLEVQKQIWEATPTRALLLYQWSNVNNVHTPRNQMTVKQMIIIIITVSNKFILDTKFASIELFALVWGLESNVKVKNDV